MKKGEKVKTPKTPGKIIQKIYKVILWILLGFVSAVLSNFVWSGWIDTIDEKLFGKAEIYVNINELHPLEEGLHEDFALMFGTQNGIGMVVAVHQVYGGLNNVIKDVFIPLS